MFTEIVTFPLKGGATREEVLEKYKGSVEIWEQNPDLIRKYYLFDPVKLIGGGVYLWKEKGNAEKWHGDAFKERIKTTYNSLPKCEIFETPIVVDNS
ncbi:MAG: hypothetical protein QNL04_10030 [SAR324 cluster bacterium]|nr:hypothetical protein [SAR324 cluster bacterium]